MKVAALWRDLLTLLSRDAGGGARSDARATRAGRLLAASSILSLLICLAVAWLWLSSHRHEDRLSRCVRGTRYTLASAGGKLVLYVPPPLALNPQAAAQAEATVAAVRNDQVYWVVTFFDDSGESNSCYVTVTWPLFDTPADEVFLNQTMPVAPLLRALEDPDRFAAAHVLLWLDWRPDNRSDLPHRTIPGRTLGRNTDEYFARQGHAHASTPWIQVDHDGLTVMLNRWADHERTGPIGKDTDSHGLVGDIDPSQLPRIRDQWHRRLDVPAMSVAWKHVFLAALFLLSLQTVIGVRRRARRIRAVRDRLCLSCGYDLRATQGRCPECGTPMASA